MGQAKTPLHLFWDDIDAEMNRLYGKDTFDLQVDTGRIRIAFALGASPQDAAFLFGRAA